jgi:carbonic anhydrase
LKTSSVDASGWHDSREGPGSAEGKYVDWLTIKDQEANVREDVNRIKSHSLGPADIQVYWYYYDVKTGKLIEMPA